MLLPGVGEASTAMHKLQERGLCEVIRNLKMPVLGICIGMQLMCRHSDEGDVDCLGIFDASVTKFIADPQNGVKVPHMGWNAIDGLKTRLFEGLSDGDFVYFVHSFYLKAKNARPVIDIFNLPLKASVSLSTSASAKGSFTANFTVTVFSNNVSITAIFESEICFSNLE